MTLLDFSQQIFGNKGNNYSPAQIAATETNSADVLYGTAQVDADSGEVEVLIDGTEIPVDPDDPDYGLASTMTCATEELIQAGDRVTVVRNGQNAKAIVLSPDSTGAAAAQQAADEAKAVAEATGQHFWHRSTDPDGDGAGTGAFVTEEEQDDFLTAAASGFADYDPSTKPYRNVLMNSLGFLIREALHNLASFTQSAVSFFDGSGNVTARFGSGGAVVGMVADGESRTEVATSGLHIYQRVSGNDVSIADLGYGTVIGSGGQQTTGRYYTFGQRRAWESIGKGSVAEGANVTASSSNSHAEGYETVAGGIYSHAEGERAKATGAASHAEGRDTTASGVYAHSEGTFTTAGGRFSHAEGSYASAGGDYSHAQNHGTIASSDYQTAMGKHNIEDNADTYLLIIGNGTADNARSNALTVAWNGDVEIAGALTQAKDTSWAYLVGDANSTNYVRWRCKSGWVQVEINYDSGASVPTSGSKLFGTIPSGYRPDRVVSVACYFNSNNTGSAWVRQSGEVRAVTKASSSQATCYAAFSYPLD